jgi:cytochrome c
MSAERRTVNGHWSASRRRSIAITLVLLTAFALAAGARTAANPLLLGNPVRGAGVFAQCERCHSFVPGRNLNGPTLHGLFGRKAGSVPGFGYSPAMKGSTIVWGEDTLSEFLSNPAKFAPNDKPVHPRIADPTQLGDLLAYLEQASK